MVTVAVNALSIPGFGQQQVFVEKFKPICDTQRRVYCQRKILNFKNIERIVCMCVSAPSMHRFLIILGGATSKNQGSIQKQNTLSEKFVPLFLREGKL